MILEWTMHITSVQEENNVIKKKVRKIISHSYSLHVFNCINGYREANTSRCTCRRIDSGIHSY